MGHLLPHRLNADHIRGQQNGDGHRDRQHNQRWAPIAMNRRPTRQPTTVLMIRARISRTACFIRGSLVATIELIAQIGPQSWCSPTPEECSSLPVGSPRLRSSGSACADLEDSFEQAERGGDGSANSHTDLHAGTDYFFLTLSVVPFLSSFVSGPSSFP